MGLHISKITELNGKSIYKWYFLPIIIETEGGRKVMQDVKQSILQLIRDIEDPDKLKIIYQFIRGIKGI